MLRRTFLALCITVAAALTLAGPPSYYPAALGDFDGGGDYLNRASDLIGNADGKTGILSAWVRIDGGDATNLTLMANESARFWFYRDNTNFFRVIGKDAGGTTRLNIYTSAKTAGTPWIHVLASWNLATAATHIYLNDVSDVTVALATNFDLDIARIAWAAGAAVGGAVSWNGAIAEFYFAPNQYLDFSVVANRRKFIDASGYPVDLGPSGYKPTGTAPLVYMRTQFNNCGLNSGTGGDFVINGAPAYTVGPVPFPLTTWAPGSSRGRGGRGGRIK